MEARALLLLVIITKQVALSGVIVKIAAMLTPRQTRAARMLLNWTQRRLAGRAGVALGTVVRLERGKVFCALPL